jgi:hypothetical protein
MKVITVLSAAVLAVAISVSTAPALDLTGTWQGKVKCKGLGPDGSKAKSVVELQWQVSQAGDFAFVWNPALNSYWAGEVIAKANNGSKGVMFVADCAVCDILSTGNGTISLLKASANPGGGKIRGVALRRELAAGYLTCKYALNQVDNLDPGVGFCPQ